MILDASGMKRAEAAAVKAGVSLGQLMENAGTGAAGMIMDLADKSNCEKTALLLCGKGNNAGDAFVVARLLTESGWLCQVLPLIGDEFSSLAQLNWQRQIGRAHV